MRALFVVIKLSVDRNLKTFSLFSYSTLDNLSGWVYTKGTIEIRS